MISAASPNSAIETSAGTTRRRWPSHAATSTATSGGSASAESSWCAAPSDAAPLITASSVAADAPSAVSRSQGLGADACITLLQLQPQVAQAAAGCVTYGTGCGKFSGGGGEGANHSSVSRDPRVVADAYAAAPAFETR